VPGTHQSATLDVDRPIGMSSKGIDKWKKPIEKAAGFDAFEAMVDDVLGMDDDNDRAKPSKTYAMDSTAAMDEKSPQSADSPSNIVKKKSYLAESLSSVGKNKGGNTVPQSAFEPIGDEKTNQKIVSAPTPLTFGALHNLELGPGQPRQNMTPPNASKKTGKEMPAAPSSVNQNSAPVATSWLLKLFGHILCAILGLAIGYVVINWAKPGLLPPISKFW
jgi:hypothetical protein